jgi:hypothetical protein
MSDIRDEMMASAREAAQLHSRNAHEAAVVRRFLRHFAPQRNVKELLTVLGRQALTTDLLPNFLTGMPLRLAADPVRYLDEITATDLLAGNLPGTQIWRAFVAAVERAAVDLRRTYFGLVIPWTGATTVVLHNWPRHEEALDRGRSYGRFVLVSCKHASVPMLYSLEPLESLILALERAGVKGRED